MHRFLKQLQAFGKAKQRLFILLLLLMLLIGILSLFLYHPLISLIASLPKLADRIYSLGNVGILMIVCFMALQIIIVFLPGEIIEVMAGYLYGPWHGMCYCLFGAALGSTFIYLLGKMIGDAFMKFMTKQEVSLFSEKEQAKYHFDFLLFLLFLIPGTPKDIITYLIPFTDMKLSRFLFLSSMARIPSLLISTLSGSTFAMKQYGLSIILLLGSIVISLLGIYFCRIKNVNKQQKSKWREEHL